MHSAQPGLLFVCYTVCNFQKWLLDDKLLSGGRMLSLGTCDVQHTEAGTRALQLLGRLVRALGAKRQVHPRAGLLPSCFSRLGKHGHDQEPTSHAACQHLQR